jgi:small subunit ribosomal protein S13
MIYLFKSKIPENKSVFFALTYIYGLSNTNSAIICKKLGFSYNLKIKYLSNNQISQILRVIENSNIELASDLKKIKLLTKNKLVSIKSYRGLRRIQGFPVRGQRTHTNAKTSRKIK